MTSLQAAILGTVQGLTEFLPISSSGHLVLFEQFFGIQSTSLHFEVVVHVATLFAVLIFFFKDLNKLKFRYLAVLGIGTIPAVLVGLFLKDQVEAAFSSITEVAIEFFITGIILFIAQRELNKREMNPKHNSLESTSPLHGLIIGIAQAIAIFPAISRSGSTVAAALKLHISREEAFRFSFLLSIPAILGASVLTLIDITKEGIPTTDSVINYLIGGIFAFIFGVMSLLWFKRVMQKAQLHYFGYYCCALSVLLLINQFIL